MPQRDPHALLPLTEVVFNILLALADEMRHGYAIIKDIEERTGGRMSPATGTIYLALQRLEEDGVIAEAKGKSPPSDKRRRRHYTLTAFGRRVMTAEAERLASQLGIAIDKGVVDVDIVRS